ncbi:hypothetical protein PSA5_14405, partial [Pseudomonas syringae pv. actinidiae]
MTAAVLGQCYAVVSAKEPNRQAALHKAISCYYSGNPKRGFKAEAEFGGSSHVQRVMANAGTTTVTVPALEGGSAEPSQLQRAQAPASTVERPMKAGTCCASTRAICRRHRRRLLLHRVT